MFLLNTILAWSINIIMNKKYDNNNIIIASRAYFLQIPCRHRLGFLLLKNKLMLGLSLPHSIKKQDSGHLKAAPDYVLPKECLGRMDIVLVQTEVATHLNGNVSWTNRTCAPAAPDIYGTVGWRMNGLDPAAS
jgi:hypothetical protein